MEALEIVVGQEGAKRFLAAGLASNTLPQTLVFVGPEGVGKTTAALAVAKALHGSDKQTHPDTFRFSTILSDLKEQKKDSPAKATIDEMIRFLSLSPFSSKVKVAIIDDPEALTDLSQNALLKTLEEPKADAVIILIAENEAQLLPTILSRAQVVRFAPLTSVELKQVVPEVSDDVLRLAMGSASTAQKLLSDAKYRKRAEEFQAFWQEADKSDTERKMAMTEGIKDREEASWFARVGMSVWHEELQKSPSSQISRRLANIQKTLMRIEGNVNQRIALEALLLVF